MCFFSDNAETVKGVSIAFKISQNIVTIFHSSNRPCAVLVPFKLCKLYIHRWYCT